jgi:pantothenate kinase
MLPLVNRIITINKYIEGVAIFLENIPYLIFVKGLLGESHIHIYIYSKQYVDVYLYIYIYISVGE